jgi:hypothetical protein
MLNRISFDMMLVYRWLCIIGFLLPDQANKSLLSGCLVFLLDMALPPSHFGDPDHASR